MTPAASAAGSLWRMTSHERPTLLRMCQSTSRNISRGDDHRVAEEGWVALADRGSPDRVPAERRLGVPEEAAGPVREVGGRQHDRDRPGEHQRDQRQVEPAHAQRRQADDRAEHHRDHARHAAARSGTAAPVANSSRAATHAAERQDRDLPERHEPDAAHQQASPSADDRVDRHGREDLEPVRAEQVGQRDQDEREQDDDHHGAHAVALVEPRRRPGGSRAGWSLDRAHRV